MAKAYYPVVERSLNSKGQKTERYIGALRGSARETKDQTLERQHFAEKLAENQFILLPTAPKKIPTDNVVGIWREALAAGESEHDVKTRFQLSDAEVTDWKYRACNLRGCAPLSDSVAVVADDAIQGGQSNGGEATTEESDATTEETTEATAEATETEIPETGIVKTPAKKQR